MELIDSHAHLTFKRLVKDVEGVIDRSIEAGVSGWVTVGTDTEQNQQVVALAEKYENMYAAVGIHPHDAKHVTDYDLIQLKQIAQSQKVVAVGEMGLDFYYNFSDPAVQKKVFRSQLLIARELGLPVIVHSREAFEETVEILDGFKSGFEKLVFHCFGGSAEQAKILIDKGFYISFTGVVTFKNATDVQEAAGVVPVERMMVETDCPYMSPEPMRKQKVNEPALMVHTAKFLAELKGMDAEDFAMKVTETTRGFFGLG